MKIQFSKMHSCGNDFMVIDGINKPINLVPQRIVSLGNRHKGVGFDQVLVVQPKKSENTDFYYQIYNSDGTEAKQCGNGARCLAKFIWDMKLSYKNTLKLGTASNPIAVRRHFESHKISVNMGKPIIDAIDIPTTLTPESTDSGIDYKLPLDNDEILPFTALSMGNPHVIFDVGDVDVADVERIGAAFQHNDAFPEQANVSFVQYLSSTRIRMRVYERGAAETLACGTAACAAVVSAIMRNKLIATEVDDFIEVSMPGGELWVQWLQSKGSIVILKGDAKTSYRGELFL